MNRMKKPVSFPLITLFTHEQKRRREADDIPAVSEMFRTILLQSLLPFS